MSGFDDIYTELCLRVSKCMDLLGPQDVSKLTLVGLFRGAPYGKITEIIKGMAKELGTEIDLSKLSLSETDLEDIASILAPNSRVDVDLTPPIDISCMLGKCWIAD